MGFKLVEMKLNNASITILVGIEETTIEIKDQDSLTTFVKCRLTPDQLSSALSRLMATPCEVEVLGLDRVGKKQENKRFEFRIPADKSGGRNSDALYELAKKALKESGMEEWVPDKYFSSQDSFFMIDKINYARCVIRRWLDKC